MKPKKTTEEYLRELGQIRLFDISRARMEKNLLEYAQFHALPEGARVEDESRSIDEVPSGASLITRIRNTRFSFMTAALLIALFIGGGTSFAAETARPGDLLYPIKIEVNERAKSAVAVSHSAEAKLQARLAEERLSEAEELAAEGKLDAETSAEVSARLKAHYEGARTNSDAALASGDYESAALVRASLEGMLRTHAITLTTLSAQVSGNASTLLISEITGYANDSAKAQATATANISADTKANVETAIENTDSLLVETQTQLKRAEATLKTETYAWIESKMTSALKAQATAKASFSAEKYQEAYTAVQAAIRLAHEAKALIDSSLLLDLDLEVTTKGVVDIDTNLETDETTNTPPQKDSTPENDSVLDGSAGVDVKTDSSVKTNIIETQVNTDTSLNVGSVLR